MNHKVENVQALYESAVTLYNNYVVGGEYSADSILDNLSQGVENLKNNWKGKDAGLRIQEVIRVHNAMVAVRNALAQLSADSSKIASNYREIQNANGANLESLGVLNFDMKSDLSDYSDTSDTIDINPSAQTGKNFIDAANNALEPFVSSVRATYDEIMGNWLSGTNRDVAQEAFDTFLASVNNYQQTLSDVSNNITKSLENYSF